MNERTRRIFELGLDLVEAALVEARAEIGTVEPLPAAIPIKPDGGMIRYFAKPIAGALIEGPADDQVRIPAKAVGKVGPFVLVEPEGRKPQQVAVKPDRFVAADNGALAESEFAGENGAPVSVDSFLKPDCSVCGSFPCRCATKEIAGGGLK